MKTKLLLWCATGWLVALTGAQAATLYVDAASTNAVPPFANWANAAANIQDAVDAAAPGDEIVVTDGVYQTGARAVYGMSNRVAVTKAVTVRSVNGPEVTIIFGQGPIGENAIRCVYLTNGALLAGFALTNGATQADTFDATNHRGAGAWCEGLGAILTNCVIAGNWAYEHGGGVFSGTLKHCVVMGNRADYNGGGAYGSTLEGCTLIGNSAESGGGGVHGGTLNGCMLSGNAAEDGGASFGSTLLSCTISNNYAGWSGGGVSASTLNDCKLIQNLAAYNGGGANNSFLTNCTLEGNLTDSPWSDESAGGGAYNSTLENCLITGNRAGGEFGDGGGAIYSTLNNCIISGNGASEGGGVLSCTLNNCTLSNNRAGDGGGAVVSTLTNCIITGNSAWGGGGGVAASTLYNCTLSGNYGGEYGGGGAYVSTLYNCALTGNHADFGGGAYGGTLNNCTVTGNSAGWAEGGGGGGTCDSTLNNSIVYYNTSYASGANYLGGTFNYSCTTPLPVGGTGNISTDPQLAGTAHLGAASPCRSAGSAAYTSRTDLDGEPWANPPSMGCDEYWTGSVTGAVRVAFAATYISVVPGFVVDFHAVIGGRVSASQWDLGDGLVVSNRLSISHAWTALGDYVVELRAYNETHPTGVATSVVVRVVEGLHYVSAASTNPVPPYTNWATAATRIQDAVDAAVPGARVLVSDGLYQTGGASVRDESNRVAVTRPVTLRSVNGPGTTIIDGAAAMRCVYLANGAVLTGFTLTNGAASWGGGVWCESTSAVVSNCTLAGNSVSYYGGGAYSGLLENCVLTGNSAQFGGGASSSTLNNCALTGNSATGYGYGGGAYEATLNHCTLIANSAARYGGGASWSTLENCIVLNNSAPTGPNYSSSTLSYSCTTPLPGGPGNIANAPLFVNTNGWSNLRLQSNSPCINAGHNASVASSTDLDGRPRIVGGVVDMGAYEYQGPGTGEFIGWLQQSGLPTDGSADAVDTDHDGHNNWQEWVAGTEPTNALSVLQLASPVITPTNVVLTWTSVTNRTYTLEQATNLGDPSAFSVLRSNLAGLPGTTSWTDTNAPVASPRFYQLRVSP